MSDMRFPRPTRRWFQYSLRSLMLFVTLWAVAVQFPGRQNSAGTEAGGSGGGDQEGGRRVHTTTTNSMRRGRLLQVAQPPGPAWLRKVLGDGFFCNVVHVAVCDDRFGDAEMAHLEDLPRLKRLISGPISGRPTPDWYTSKG